MTTTCTSCGTISLSMLSHLPLMECSYSEKPVKLAVGRARLETMPVATGSDRPTNTIGIVWVASRKARVVRVLVVKITSGAIATS